MPFLCRERAGGCRALCWPGLLVSLSPRGRLPMVMGDGVASTTWVWCPKGKRYLPAFKKSLKNWSLFPWRQACWRWRGGRNDSWGCVARPGARSCGLSGPRVTPAIGPSPAVLRLVCCHQAGPMLCCSLPCLSALLLQSVPASWRRELDFGSCLHLVQWHPTSAAVFIYVFTSAESQSPRVWGGWEKGLSW